MFAAHAAVQAHAAPAPRGNQVPTDMAVHAMWHTVFAIPSSTIVLHPHKDLWRVVCVEAACGASSSSADLFVNALRLIQAYH
jgi:hypothetical protein